MLIEPLERQSVSTEIALDFDVGPLSWVQGEVDQALARGLESLAAYAADPSATSALAHARNHVHQASGAILMVGLDAVAAYAEEIEKQLARLETIDAANVAEVVALIDRACQKLRIFLDELVNGIAPVPLKLYPEFEAMQLARGVKAVAPTDLFYPDLSPRAPRSAPREAIAPAKLTSFLVKQRRMYQRGLLSWLRGEEQGGKTMRDAVAAIADATPQPNLRAFWWTADALFEAIVGGGLEAGFGLKQLAARIDLQIRRVAEGGAKVADRLRREVLYYVAVSAPIGPQLQAVQKTFRLSGLIPSAEVLSADVVWIQPLLREAREQLAGAKDSWLKAAAGRAENLPKLKQTLASVHNKAVEIKHGALMKLTAALVERLDKLPAAGVSEPLAMEYATALLLAESAFENYSNLAPDFGSQVNAMLTRLDAARAGRSISASAPMLDEMSKRAQERVLLSQVGREIRANLRHMEQVLDAFFRDNAKRGELATLAKDSQQIRGALNVLGLNDAERLLAMCEQQIERYASPDTPVADDELELLAESLSGLGFFIEAVEQQRPDRDRLIAPLIARRMGEAPAPAVTHSDSVEDAVAELRSQLPQLVAEIHRAPADAAARDQLQRKLAGLRDDAELIGDVDLLAQADAALKEFKTGGTDTLAAAVEMIADAGITPAPEISAETQRLLDTDTTGLDAELLDIYLTEAAEVLDTVVDRQRALTHNPGDREALETLRRQFHTLKGSGRMVGLIELGELAWQVEQVGNRLIEEDRSVTPAVLALFDVAEKSFRGWVDELRQTRRVVADAQALHNAIDAVTQEWPSGAKPQAPVLRVAATSAEARQVIPATPADFAATTLPTLELIELPELGAAAEADGPAVEAEEPAPEDEVVDVPSYEERTSLPPILKLVADNSHVVPANEPDRRLVFATIAEPDDVTIGATTLSTSLWKILCDEADAHVATLHRELSVLQSDARAAPSPEMVRASHTLCGIHRTGGLPLIAETSNALEQALLALVHHGAPLPSASQSVLPHAVEGLARLIGRVRAREDWSDHDRLDAQAIAHELEALRHDAVGGGSVDAETVAAETAQREDEIHTEVPADVIADAEIIIEQAASDALLEHDALVTTIVAPPHGARHDIDVRMPQKTGDPLAGIRDDVDAQVLEIFLEEATELYPQGAEQVRAWRRSPRDTQIAQQLRRTLHTFKGSARMAGAMRLGELTHLMESRLMQGDSLREATPDLFEALDTDLDHIGFVLDALRDGRTNVPLPEFDRRTRDVIADTATGVTSAAAPHHVAMPPEAAHPIVVPLTPSAPAHTALTPSAAEPADVEASTRAMLRVRADIVDRLVNEAGEVAIARARIEGELRALKSNLLELTNSVIRLRGQVREIELQAETQIQSRMTAIQTVNQEFDPLELDRFTRFQELTRSLAEGVNDVSTVQQALLKNLDDADAALLAQARMSRDVQQRLFAIRTVPFASLSERLYRILRTTAKELDKRVNLEIDDGQTELDRSVLEKLVGPLEHLLRNALDHGIESRADRLKAGKPETGEISLKVRQVNNEVLIELADDGAGINFANVGNRARALGLVPGDVEPSEQQLIECLFQPGFSTASKVTQISGRGIGMDVVRAEITALGGRVEVHATEGRGTRFMLYLPLTLAVAQAVLVRAGGRMWALPAPTVEQVQQIKGEELLNLYVKRKVEWQGRTYPFHYLPRLLGDAQHTPETQRFNAVLLLRSGQGIAAIHVDEMIGNQEVVVKNIGPQLARVSGISGATVLGTGEIVLIINPVQLAMRPEVTSAESEASDERVIGDRPRTTLPVAARSSTPLVMIVDDSLTVRKVTSRLLQREGFDVVTAKDGVDALQILEDQTPDVILLDIEMPRMDGFEFTKTMKTEPKNAHIPIIMITSRTAEKHRNRAAELGVDLYLGKPYQEEDLLRNLRDMLSITAPGVTV
jgi:chemosensory pili system protein ChpA (sensor histidine kinase/response regulator)